VDFGAIRLMDSAPNARVLIVADEDVLAGPLAEGLDKLGWRTLTARSAAAALYAASDLEIDAAIVDIRRFRHETDSFVSQLRAACAPRRLAVIGLGAVASDTAAERYDLLLAQSPHPAQVALRLEQLVRVTVSEEEFELRTATFLERGVRLEPPLEGETPLRILTIGSPAPQFLALSNALNSTEAEVVGAFTAYTAFDYLHERPFDAAVLWGGDDEGDAMAIASGMRRNTRLFHIPTILYLKAADELNLSEIFNRGVTDVAAPDTRETETATRVVALARAYRRQTAVRRALENVRGSGLMDKTTGLFTRDLFAAHLARLAVASKDRNRPLSVCVLKVADRSEVARARAGGWLDRAMPQIGSMVSRLVRAEDTAARLAPEVFALALPATPLSQAKLVGERIAAVIGCTAFEAGAGSSPFVAEFEMGVAEVAPGESAAKALERAAAQTFAQRAAS
jgi:two-component system cell cycle response regulator PopA